MKRERIVCIEWDDASYNSGYYDKEHPEKFTPIRTRTVGHLIKNHRDRIVVSQDRFYDDKGRVDDDRHLSVIPKKMVKKIIELGAK